MNKVEIDGRLIGNDEPTFIVAEMSANHDQDLDQAISLVDLAADAGVDALKLQTYTADSLSLPTGHPSARIDPIWGASNLYELYAKAAMPYDFHAPLFERAKERGLIAFSTVFDLAGVDYLEELGVPAYKIASSELVHHPLLRRVGATGKPVILSTGMASIGEVEEALGVLTAVGAEQIVILHCCSMYPADPSMVNLAAMDTLQRAFPHPVGFSDHTVGYAVPIAAAARGACMIEKHFTNDCRRAGPDHRFSIEDRELRIMVDCIRQATLSIGNGNKQVTPGEVQNRAVGRRSLFAKVDISKGETISQDMLAIVRPGAGLHPRFQNVVVGRDARRKIHAGSPIVWDDI